MKYPLYRYLEGVVPWRPGQCEGHRRRLRLPRDPGTFSSQHVVNCIDPRALRQHRHAERAWSNVRVLVVEEVVATAVAVVVVAATAAAAVVAAIAAVAVVCV